MIVACEEEADKMETEAADIKKRAAGVKLREDEFEAELNRTRE
jgi:hypothetical protein